MMIRITKYKVLIILLIILCGILVYRFRNVDEVNIKEYVNLNNSSLSLTR